MSVLRSATARSTWEPEKPASARHLRAAASPPVFAAAYAVSSRARPRRLIEIVVERGREVEVEEKAERGGG
jgi:hypothetical protein